MVSGTTSELLAMRRRCCLSPWHGVYLQLLENNSAPRQPHSCHNLPGHPRPCNLPKACHFHYLFGFAGLGLGFLCSASEHLNSRRAIVASSRGILCKATVVMIAKLACPIGQSSYVLLDGILSGYYMIYMLRAPTQVIHFIDL